MKSVKNEILEYLQLAEKQSDYVPNFSGMKYSPVICHWLDFSFSYLDTSLIKPIDIINELNVRFGFNFVVNVDRFDNVRGGMPGYCSSYICTHTSSLVCFDGVNEYQKNNVFLRFPGGAVQNLYINNLFDTFLIFINSFNSPSCTVRCVRMDLAKDCFTGFFDFCKDYVLSTRQRIITTLSAFPVANSVLDNRFNVKSGWTFYAGRRSNAIFIRVYDKAAERKLNDNSVSWVRVEIEIKHSEKRTDWANDCFKRILNGESLSSIYKEKLNTYFRIVEENDVEIGDPHRTQKTQVSPEFLEFINHNCDDFTKHKFCEELQQVDYKTKQKNCQELLSYVAPISFEGLTIRQIIGLLFLNCRKYQDKYFKDFNIHLNSYIDDNDILNSIPYLAVDIDGVISPYSGSIELDHKSSFDTL